MNPRTRGRDLADRHRRALAGFTGAVEGAEGKWELPTPCIEWDVRAVVEHVIGFHEVLLLRPLGVRANRPWQGPPARWAATSAAISEALDHDLDVMVEVPGSGDALLSSLVGPLTTDVLVHTWDLARATGGDDALDAELCELAIADLLGAEDRLRRSGMYEAPVAVAPRASAQVRLIAFTGRHPEWGRHQGRREGAADRTF